MEQRITERFSDAVLEQAASRYAISLELLQPLNGFESFLFIFEQAGQKGILRISHSIRRSPDLIRGEMDWINYLHRGGVRVARPIPSSLGNWVEELEDGQGGQFLAAAFDWAPGEIHEGSTWAPSLLQEYGRQLGRMHRLAPGYQPGDPAWKRPEWHDPVNLDFNRFLPKADHRILKRYLELKDYLFSLPAPPDGYGMIHQDPHPGNFHVAESDRITFFDFDDCAYGWFVNDIALVLFYTSLGVDDPDQFFPTFLDGFLPGYLQEFRLDPKWFREIPHFAKLREMDLYALIHRSFDLDNLDPWCSWYMAGRQQRLEEGLPFLAFEPESFNWDAYY